MQIANAVLHEAVGVDPRLALIASPGPSLDALESKHGTLGWPSFVWSFWSDAGHMAVAGGASVYLPCPMPGR